MPEQDKKRKLWDIDPSMYESKHEASFFERRVVPSLRQIGKFGLYALAITYPLYLVYVGLAFGGLAFWSFFAGSLVVMSVIITRLGYAANFSHWDIGSKRTLGILLGFAVAAGFYLGLLFARTWLVPSAFGLAALGVFLVLRRFKS